jgi:ABC-2 type transport system ATP-binding protein
MREGVTEERIREVVHLVGLDKRINDKVGKYSLGMRQRLGVAQAIMHHPKVLILDEPTNGLDPAGIKELRDILKKLAHEEKVGVLVSSHLMSEMELMCDRVGVIVNGVMIDEKPIGELIAAAAPDKINIVYSVSNPDGLIEKLDFIPHENIAKNEDGTIDIILPRIDINPTLSRINKLVVDNGIELYTVSPKENKKLEDVFIELTKTSGGVQID